MPQFVHLHTHTEYSLLDGASTIPDLVGYAKDLGMEALAITDHGVMYGAVEFYQECVKQGIKPIIGCEVYVAEGSALERRREQKRFHLILLAENEEGYHNLMKLVSYGCLEGFYYKPRVDKEALRRYHKGLICLSACLQGEVSYHLVRGEMTAAKQAVEDYCAIFGRDNFFLELQDHDLPEDKEVYCGMQLLAEQYKLGLVATNDVHYVRRTDAAGQDILLCIQTNSRYSDRERMRMNNDMYYLKSAEEMAERFPLCPQALANTVAIAERCNVKLTFGQLLLPKFPLPEGVTEAQYLRQLCEEGFSKRYDACDMRARERMEYELSIIHQMGYDGYFLIVWDFINYCRTAHIPVGPGRGSAAGSIVAYLTTITNIDPLRYNLLFERFLNPERVSMPDIDTDICYVKRHLVVDYLSRKYGASHVAQIITFGTLAAKAAVKDVGRALEISLDTVNKVTKLISSRPGVTLSDAIESSRELQQLAREDKQIAQMLDYAQMVEGRPRHTSTHAAGVVITPGELTDYVPLQLTASQDEEGQEYICIQYDMNKAGELGLLKMDLLGLRTLTVIDDTLRNIERTQGLTLDIDAIDLRDRATCAMLCKGDTACVFQMESAGMTQLMRELAPESFEDLIPLVALYRPGPLGSGMSEDFINGRHGKRTAKVLHPLMEPVLADTYGVILYQEQVMQLTSALAGFTLGEADILRRAMGKKKAKELNSMQEKFIQGAKNFHDIERPLAEEIFSLLQHFAGYGFNKSHSAAYAYVAFQTAYLKAHYPVEFMAAFLDSVIGNSTKLNWYINVCHSMGIKILPPDVNSSSYGFTVAGGGIRFGLAAIKNMGDIAVETIITERTEHGAFSSLLDFAQRVDLTRVNKRMLENLIYSGAMDSLGMNRASLRAALDSVVERCSSEQRERQSGQMDLFAGAEFAPSRELPMPHCAEMPLMELLTHERELLGLYVTGNPLDAYEAQLRYLTPIANLTETKFHTGDSVQVGGMVASCKIRTTKNGEPMANLVIEDLTGSINALVFPRSYMRLARYIGEGQAVWLVGKVNFSEEEPKLYAELLRPLAEAILLKPKAPEKPRALHIYLGPEQNTARYQSGLESVFRRHHGKVPVVLHLADKVTVIKVKEDFWVEDSAQLRAALTQLLGEGCGLRGNEG